MWYWWFIIGAIVGVIITSITCFIFNKKRSSYGTLKIDNSNPEKDIYRFEVRDLDDLSRKKVIVLKVDNHANLSQK